MQLEETPCQADSYAGIGLKQGQLINATEPSLLRPSLCLVAYISQIVEKVD